MLQIEFIPEAVDDLRSLRKYDQQRIVTAIESQLLHQATQPSRNRKRLRPNQLAETASADQLYRNDLAHIHVEGYGFHWEGAASVIVGVTVHGVGDIPTQTKGSGTFFGFEIWPEASAIRSKNEPDLSP